MSSGGIRSIVLQWLLKPPVSSKHTKQSLRGETGLLDFGVFVSPSFSLTFHRRFTMTSTKRADFEAIFPSLAQDILAHAKRYNLPQNALEWLEKVGSSIIVLFHLITDPIIST